MDILDSPLNLAHQQSRKAERYLKAGRYEEAINCHQRAAEYLTKAMASTTIQQALESFSLQRESHIRQQAIIREKQRCHLWAEKQKHDKGNGNSPLSRAKRGSSGSEQVHSPGSDVDMASADRGSYVKSLHQSDALLCFLNNRTAKCKDFDTRWPEFMYSASAETKDDDPEDPGLEVVSSRLLCQNDALRNHIVEFLKESEENHKQIAYLQRELDFCRKENRDLKDRLSKTERGSSTSTDPSQTDTLYSLPIGLNLDNLPDLELPPLEMPKFDFDSLKTCSEDEITTQ